MEVKKSPQADLENKKNILSIGIAIAEKVLRRKFEDESSMNLLILDVPKVNYSWLHPFAYHQTY